MVSPSADCSTSCLSVLTRRKEIDSSAALHTNLRRCLSTLDLALIGIGGTLGSGVYVLTGDISKNVAGPAIVLSYLLAGFGSALSGFCYAEFGARVPRSGSAYLYTYVSVGELLGFVVGWNLLLEYIIGGASVARGLSSYLDSLLNDTIKKTMIEKIGTITIFGGETYLDFVSFGVCILYMILLIVGVKSSSRFNNLCTFVNIIVITMCIAMGAFYVDIDNWKNFTPYGVNGVVSGASSCFFAFIGFDAIATIGEEARTPSKSIPVSIVGTIVICFLAYFGVSTIINLMLPYYKLSPDAALADAFKQRGLPAAQYIVAVGVMFGLSGTTLVSMMPTPRLLYAIAQDGLVFKFFAKVHKKTEVPHLATIVTGLLTAFMALVLDLKDLVDMVSIGTLLAYTLVVTSVLLLRYRKISIGISKDTMVDSERFSKHERKDTLDGNSFGSENSFRDEFRNGFIGHADSGESSDIKRINDELSGTKAEPTKRSELTVAWAVVAIYVEVFAMTSLLVYESKRLFAAELIILIPFCILAAMVIVTTVLISIQPQNRQKLFFKTPLVPWLPVVAIFVNVYLLLSLNRLTWIRLGVWMAIGFAIYFLYGIRHSTLHNRLEYEQIPDFTSTGTFESYAGHKPSRTSKTSELS